MRSSRLPSAKLSTRLMGNSGRFGSKHLMQQFASRLRLTAIAVEEMNWHRRVGVSYRRADYVSPALRRVIDMLKSTARDIDKDLAETAR